MLSPYRVLDLTSGGSMFCGRILADLSADVVKVEKPGGDPSRNVGPFYHDIPDPRRSLNWLAYNLGKRSVTLDIETNDGKAVFRDLVRKADFVLESFAPGYLDGIALGYVELSKLNPDLIMTSISPYGQEGPYAGYEASDITLVAMGGFSYITGYQDGEPMRVTVPQAELIAGSQAAAATLIAQFHRAATGEGQHIDVSTQACVTWTITNTIPFWELDHSNLRRQGSALFGRAGGVKQRLIWKCRDGFVTYTLMGGKFGAKDNIQLTRWMDEEGMADDFVRNFNWPDYNIAATDQETQDNLEGYISRFFLAHSKKELYLGGLKKGIKVYPVNSPRDTTEDDQLNSRDFWVSVDHPDLTDKVIYPGPFFKSNRMTFSPVRPAPRIGEHNREIYHEIGLDDKQIGILKQSGTI